MQVFPRFLQKTLSIPPYRDKVTFRSRFGSPVLSARRLFLPSLLAVTVLWGARHFGHVSMVSILYTLTIPLEGTDPTLSALGVDIAGGRLALGTDLFSGEATLSEQLGPEALNNRVFEQSDYYQNVLYVQGGA